MIGGGQVLVSVPFGKLLPHTAVSGDRCVMVACENQQAIDSRHK